MQIGDVATANPTRETVAAEVRQAVARTGLSQAEFAARIGTAGSRLSTYLNGKVAPSAALMVRMRRLADRLESTRADRSATPPHSARR